MDIHFIGNGSAFNPRLKNTSAFFKADNNLFVLDCGLDTFHCLQGSGELEAAAEIIVIITHLHGDHCGGLAILVSYCKCVLGKEVSVICPSAAIIELLRLMGIGEDFYTYRGELSNILSGGISLRAVEVRHVENMQCFGYIIASRDDAIFYSGDAVEIPEYVLELFLKDKIGRIYADTASVDHKPSAHGCLERHKKVIPMEKRNRVYCMHMDCDFSEQIKKEGFQVVQPD